MNSATRLSFLLFVLASLIGGCVEPTGDDGPSAHCSDADKLYRAGDTFEKGDANCRCESDGRIQCTIKSDLATVCLYDGKTYAIGERFTAECNTCTCGQSGLLLCTEKECRREFDGCKVGAELYAVGQSYQRGCNTCVCLPEGVEQCTTRECPLPCSNGTPGCVPVCFDPQTNPGDAAKGMPGCPCDDAQESVFVGDTRYGCRDGRWQSLPMPCSGQVASCVPVCFDPQTNPGDAAKGMPGCPCDDAQESVFVGDTRYGCRDGRWQSLPMPCSGQAASCVPVCFDPHTNPEDAAKDFIPGCPCDDQPDLCVGETNYRCQEGRWAVLPTPGACLIE